MLKLDEMIKELQQMLTPARFRHSINTMETCIRLAENMAPMWTRLR